MTKHTAGHWEVNESNHCVFSIIGGVYHSICRVSAPTKYADDGTSEANARLIAAAPELLAELKIARRELHACQAVMHLSGYGFDPAYVDDAQAALKSIDAAIAKAAGEQA